MKRSIKIVLAFMLILMTILPVLPPQTVQASEIPDEQEVVTETSDQGSQDKDMDQGNQGEDLEQGDQGEDLEQGDQGEDLEQGDQGEDLDQGDQGEDLDQGDQGKDLEQGNQGEDLDQGNQDEDNAEEIVLEEPEIEILELKDGNYTIGLETLHATEDKASGMAKYIGDTASLSVKDGKPNLTLTIVGHKTVTGLQVEKNGQLVGESAAEIDEEADKREVTFELDSLALLTNARVQYTVGAHNGDQPFRLSFDKDSLKEIVIEEPEVKNPNPTPEILELKDGNYTIDLKALHATEDKASGMAKYIGETASLSVKDGKPNLTLTIVGHKTVTGLQVEKNGQLVGESATKIDEEADTREVTFELDSLALITNAKVQYTVGAHNGDQPFRLSFDKDSLKEIVVEEPEVEQPGQENKYADGEYTLPFEVLQAGKDEESVAHTYLKPGATLIVKDGEYTVQATLLNHSWWQYFKTETAQSGTFTDVKIISENKEEDTAVVQFNVQDIDNILKTKIHIKIDGLPGLPSFSYDNEYDIRFSFDTDGISLVTKPNPEPTPEILDLTDGNYTIDLKTLHATEDKVSGMAQYISKTASLSVKDGKPNLTLTILKHEIVTGLQVEKNGKLVGESATEIDEEADTREVTFELDSLALLTNARVQYTVGAHSGDQPFRLSFDKDSLKEIVVEEPEVEQPGQENKYADGEYTLPFEVLQAGKDEESVAHTYLQPGATLIVKDGEYTVQATLLNHSWWQYFKTETAQSGTFTDVKIISENKEEDTAIVQFNVQDIDNILNAKIHIKIDGLPGLPSFSYDNEYDIRFSFDTDGMSLVTKPNPEPNPEPTPEILDLTDGNYTIDLKTLHATEDKASGMAKYIGETASLSVKDGKPNLTLTIVGHKTVTGLQVEKNGKLVGESATEIDEEADTREVTFELDSLALMTNAKVQYTVGAHNGDQPFRLVFDKESLKAKVEQPEQENKYADGEYTLPFEVLQAGKDEESVAHTYLKPGATLIVKDGEYTVQATLLNHSWWQYFKTEIAQSGTFTDVEIISENKEEDTAVVRFNVQDIDSILNAKIHIKIDGLPGMPGFQYDNQYDIRFSFDTDGMSLVTKPEPNPEPTPEILALKDGNYTIGLKTLHATEDKASGMAKYIGDTASLSVKDGKPNLTLTIVGHKTVTGLQVEKNGKLIDESVTKIDEEADTREVTFELDSLALLTNARVQYTVGAHSGDQPFRLSFDKDSLKEIVVEEPEVEQPKPVPPTTPPTPPQVGKYANGKYNLPFTVLQADKNAESVAHSYMHPVATLIVKDGEYTVQATLLNNSWWQYFKTQTTQSGSFSDVKVISENKDTDTSVVQFKVQDIDKMLNAKVHVIVTGIPGFNYDNKYDIRFSFDTSRMSPATGAEIVPLPTPVPPPIPELPLPIELEDGNYTIDFSASGATEEEKKAMIKYLGTSAAISIEGDKKQVRLTLKEQKTITSFKIERNGKFVDATVVEIDEATDTKVVAFEVDKLVTSVKVKIEVQQTAAPLQSVGASPISMVSFAGFNTLSSARAVNNNPVEYTWNLSFDVDSIKAFEDPKPVIPKPESKYADGEYSLPFKILKDTSDEKSMTNDYMVSPAKLNVKNGNYEVTVTLNNSSWWQYLKVQAEQPGTFSAGNFVNAKVLSEDKATDTRVVKFTVQDIDKILNAKIHVIVPKLNYDNKYDIRFSFDTGKMSLVSEPEIQPVPVPQPEYKYADGEYSLPFKILKDTSDEKSMTNDYMISPAKLNVKNGNYEVTVTLNNSSWWQYLKVQAEQPGTFSEGNFVDAKVLSEDKATDTRVVKFTVQDIDKILNAKIHVIVPMFNYDNKYDIRFAFDTSNITQGAEQEVVKPGPESSKPDDLTGNDGNQTAPPVPSLPTNPTPSLPVNTAPNSNKPGVINPHKLKDGEYSIGFTVLKDKVNERSMMNDYVISPGNLKVKNGKAYVAITLIKSSWITDFKVAINGVLTEPKLLSYDANADTRIVEFEVGNLFDPLNAKVKVDIPDINYHNVYDIRFSFNTDSIKQLNNGKYPTAGNIDQVIALAENTEKPDSGAISKDSEGLSFDRDADALKEQSGEETTIKTADQKGENPKTADTTKILLFVFLIAGSVILLIMRYRKRHRLVAE